MRTWRGRFAQVLLHALVLAGALCTTLMPQRAQAQDDPPGRVGRLTQIQGQVSWFDHEEGQWAQAERNRPLTTGDKLATSADGRVELRVGSSVLRLAPWTELEVLRLDDDRMVWQLHSGSVAVRLRTREAAAETELLTGEVRMQPERAGHFRIDRVDDTTFAGAWRGTLRVQDAAGGYVDSGQRQEFWREGSASSWGAQPALRQRTSRLPADPFTDWVMAEDKQDERRASERWVSPEMTGAEDLDRYGRWDRHPEHGAVWFPSDVGPEWAPYRHGRWVWVKPWGWTWVDEARWGFAPFHYGRWVHWRGRWGWSPGAYVARPVYAPALVAWVGGPNLSVQVSVGLPSIGWVPLAPRDVFVPYYRHTPVYVERVNVPHPRHQPRDRHHPQPEPGRVTPTGPIMYGNQGVPGAVTVVPRDVLQQRRPVAPAVVQPVAGAQGTFGPALPPQYGPPVPADRSRAVAPQPGLLESAVPPASERKFRLPEPPRAEQYPHGPPAPRSSAPNSAVLSNPGASSVPVQVSPPVMGPPVPTAAPHRPPERRFERGGERGDMPAWPSGRNAGTTSAPAASPAPAAPVQAPRVHQNPAPVTVPATPAAPAGPAMAPRPAAAATPAAPAPGGQRHGRPETKDPEAEEGRKRAPNPRQMQH